MHKFFLGCDWGTSSFRLRLFDVSAQQIAGEVISDKGIAKMHSAWQDEAAQNNTINKTQFFREYLKQQVAVLSEKYNVDLHHVTIVISGMASSSIGIQDVPYATLPFALDGTQASIKQFEPDADFPHEVILISGVRSDDDVMRGEETQLIGLIALTEQSVSLPAEGVLIFPGTHSKHIHINNGQLIRFNTFMTGELFSILCNHSILKDSVDKVDVTKFSDVDAKAFRMGLQKSKESRILNSLFTVRTNQLFDKLSKKQNAFYLSGLLIGEELNYLLKTEALPLVLCSAGNLFEFYKLAVNELNLSANTTIVNVELVDKAALAGQNLIYQKHVLNKQTNER